VSKGTKIQYWQFLTGIKQLRHTPSMSLVIQPVDSDGQQAYGEARPSPVLTSVEVAGLSYDLFAIHIATPRTSVEGQVAFDFGEA
jgi:hypothetical protein